MVFVPPGIGSDTARKTLIVFFDRCYLGLFFRTLDNRSMGLQQGSKIFKFKFWSRGVYYCNSSDIHVQYVFGSTF